MTTFLSATRNPCPFILRNVIFCAPDDSVACTSSSSLCEVFIYFSIGAGVLLNIIKPGPAHTESFFNEDSHTWKYWHKFFLQRKGKWMHFLSVFNYVMRSTWFIKKKKSTFAYLSKSLSSSENLRSKDERTDFHYSVRSCAWYLPPCLTQSNSNYASQR